MDDVRKLGWLRRTRSKDAAAAWAAALTALALCLAVPHWASAEGAKSGEKKQTHADYKRLAGNWLRLDGGYVLELKDVRPEGQLKASYFNPKPVNVSKTEWRQMGDRLQVFVELRDEGYPGCTYTLVYSPEKDRLEGYYYQAAINQTFDVTFARRR